MPETMHIQFNFSFPSNEARAAANMGVIYISNIDWLAPNSFSTALFMRE
jgi:hypothetical protein